MYIELESHSEHLIGCTLRILGPSNGEGVNLYCRGAEVPNTPKTPLLRGEDSYKVGPYQL